MYGFFEWSIRGTSSVILMTVLVYGVWWDCVVPDFGDDSVMFGLLFTDFGLTYIWVYFKEGTKSEDGI